MRIIALGVVLATFAMGCMTVPARYHQPERVYQPRVERLAVAGFQRTEFVQTGGYSAGVGGNGVFGTASGWSGDYRSFSDASTMRWFLEETRCARQIGESAEAPLRVEGEAHGEEAHGVFEWTTAIVEAVTLLPIFGLPAPGKVEGSAMARLYRDGEFQRQVTSSSSLRYWTTLYTARRDAARATNLARLMALRDLADQVAADLCAGHRVTTAR